MTERRRASPRARPARRVDTDELLVWTTHAAAVGLVAVGACQAWRRRRGPTSGWSRAVLAVAAGLGAAEALLWGLSLVGLARRRRAAARST